MLTEMSTNGTVRGAAAPAVKTRRQSPTAPCVVAAVPTVKAQRWLIHVMERASRGEHERACFPHATEQMGSGRARWGIFAGTAVGGGGSAAWGGAAGGVGGGGVGWGTGMSNILVMAKLLFFV
jgi:hypothetical protein